MSDNPSKSDLFGNPSTGDKSSAPDEKPAKKETALQRETRLTGNSDLISFVSSELQKGYRLPPNIPLARKIIGRYCQAKTSQDFFKRIKDYVGGDQMSALALYTALEKGVKNLEERAAGNGKGGVGGGSGSSSILEGSAGTTIPGGLLQIKRKFHQENLAPAGSSKDVVYVRPGSTLGLDRLAQQKRAEQAASSVNHGRSLMLSPNNDDSDEDEGEGPNLLFSNVGAKKGGEQREIDKFLTEKESKSKKIGLLTRQDGGDDDDGRGGLLYDEDGNKIDKRSKDKGGTGGGVRVFRGNQKIMMKEDDEDEPAKQVHGLQHDVLDEELQAKIMHEVEMDEYDEMEADRQWYDMDEGGMMSGGSSSLTYGSQMDANELFEKEEALKKNAEQVFQRKQTLQQQERNAMSEKWEENLMSRAGFGARKEIDLDSFRNTTQGRTQHVLVSETIPPFLDGRVVYTTQADAVSVVKDPTSDLAVLAKKGSDAVKKVREDGDKHKMRDRFWEVQNSAMGALVGVDKQKSAGGESAEGDENGEGGQSVQKAADQETDGLADGEYDYRKENQFADAMKNVQASGTFGGKEKTIDEVRESLPVYQVRDKFLEWLREHQIIIAVGETGSGKTTQLTQYLYEAGYTQDDQIIGCTQPRRMAAMSVAKRVADEKKVELGTLVGYSIRFENCFSAEETKIKYMTDGVLLRELLDDQDLEKYSVIIMDEAHERGLNTDVLFGILKNVVTRRRDFKLIVTSATMDSAKFSRFFGNVPIFEIPGRTFPVETFNSKSAAQDYVKEAVHQAIQVHISQGRGDILIFMTGQEDIDATCLLLADKLVEVGDNVQPLNILPVYSTMPADLQARIFQPSPHRKAIVATNIAETSLTVDGVKYVIDTGFCKLKVYDPKVGMDSLQITPISQANANQRRGRAGRTEAGMCWRLYTEAAFVREMYEMTIPEIQRTNLAQVVLLLKSCGIENLLEFDFMDAPPQDTIIKSMYQLWMLGALDNLGRITADGRKMGDFPVDPPLGKMILTAVHEQCVSEILVVIAMINGATSIFFRPKERADEADAAREKFSVSESDHLTLLNVYQQWKRNGYSASWCGSHFLHAKGLKRVRETFTQLQDITTQHKLPLSSCGGDWDPLRKAVCSGYFHNASKMRGIGEYINLRSNVPCHLHPTSALYGLGYTPDYVVYHEVMLTTKEYMQHVTAVEPAWLAEMGPMFFSVRETGSDMSALRRQDGERQKKMEYEAQLHADRLAAAAKVEKERMEIAMSSRQQVASIGKKRVGGGVGGWRGNQDRDGGNQDNVDEDRRDAKKRADDAVVNSILSIGGGMGGDSDEEGGGANKRRRKQEDSSSDSEVVRNRRTAAQAGRKKKKMMVVGSGDKK